MRIALISCVKEKLAHPAPAIELYHSNLFMSWLKDAWKRDVDQTFILSGKYGLVHPDEIIDPYDLNLLEQTDYYRRNWYIRVMEQLRIHCKPESCHFIIYADEGYYKGLTSFFGSYELPVIR